jgi:hypothetical protein
MAMWDTISASDGRQDAKTIMDGSGWTVSTGKDTAAQGGARTQSGDPYGAGTPAVMMGGTSINQTTVLVLGAVALVVVVLLLKRKRK